MFQGSGYYESKNAKYRRRINKKRVPLPDFPREMRRAFRSRLVEQGKKDEGINNIFVTIKSSFSGFTTPKVAEDIFETLTKYAVKRYHDDIVKQIEPWEIFECRPLHVILMRYSGTVIKLNL